VGDVSMQINVGFISRICTKLHVTTINMVIFFFLVPRMDTEKQISDGKPNHICKFTSVMWIVIVMGTQPSHISTPYKTLESKSIFKFDQNYREKY